MNTHRNFWIIVVVVGLLSLLVAPPVAAILSGFIWGGLYLLVVWVIGQVRKGAHHDGA